MARRRTSERRTGTSAEKAAEHVLDLRAEVVRSFLAGVQLESTVINKVLDAAAGPRGAINAGVVAALLNWNTQSRKDLADILGLTDLRLRLGNAAPAMILSPELAVTP